MNYQVRAVRFDHGWELHIAGVGVTQSHTLDGADAMIRDYLRLDGHAEAATAGIVIVPEVQDVQAVLDEVRHLSTEALRLQSEAAGKRRQVAAALRAQGLSVADTANVLGVSKGRISQLMH